MKTEDKLKQIENLQEILNDTYSIREVLNQCKIKLSTTNYNVLRQFIKENNLISNFTNWNKSGKKRKLIQLTENSPSDRSGVKKHIIKNALKEYSCDWCGLTDSWNNKKLVLVLDHINGVSNDHRLENLRFLCPNCNSQTDTFTSKNKPKAIKKKSYCECGEIKGGQSKHCQKCYGSYLRKPRPTKEFLEKEVWVKTLKQIGNETGCGRNVIRNLCKEYNISKPEQGYWLRNNSSTLSLQ